MKTYETILSSLKQRNEIPDNDLEDFLIQTYQLLDNSDEETYNKCLAAICHVANSNPSNSMVRQLLHDCIVKSRIFLYNNLLQYDQGYIPVNSFQDDIARSYYTSNLTHTTLTRQQKEIFNIFQKDRRLIVSAPTSFGKTRIISEIIAHNHYSRIALIMPTVSLLSEQYQALKQQVDGYVVSRSSKIQIDDEGKYLLILTPERMNMFMEEHPDFKFDFFVMDEVYKADYKLDDGRYRVFADVLYRLAKTDTDFYLIGPYISDFSKKFRLKFGATMLRYETEIVQKDYYSFDHITNRGFHSVEGSQIRIVGDRAKNLLRILASDSIDGKYLIYRYQKRYVELQATSLLENWPQKMHDTALVEYLSTRVSPDWDLISCIKRGVAFHHGGMPRYIQDLIVDAFNDNSPQGIDYLFCTTSLTEGVNTHAKNVVIYDKKIGAGEQLQTLDKKNIEGRAGRFMKHFVGRVFYLEDSEDAEENVTVELEGFDSDRPSIETLIQMDEADIADEHKSSTAAMMKELSDLSIPYNLIKNNKYIPVSGQVAIIESLRASKSLRESCHFEGTIPKAEQLGTILGLIYDHLFTDSNKGKNFRGDVGKSILIGMTKFYIYNRPSFKQLLESGTVTRTSKNMSTRIRYVFDLVSKYFEFIWPRYLSAFEVLYNFVATEQGAKIIKLEMIIATLEYGTAQPHEIILRDAGLPNDVIKNISAHFSQCQTFEDVQRVAKINRQRLVSGLHPVEARMIERYL